MTIIYVFSENTSYMDFRKRDKSWLTQLGSVFGESVPSDPETRDIKDLKQKVRDLLRRRTKLWWNKAALENYLQKNIIPRGLRIQTFPTLETEDPLFMNRWEETLTKCSQTLIELLIGADRKALETAEKEIDILRERIQQVLSREDIEAFDKTLEEDLSKWEREIQSIKSKKFQRDLQDYSQKKIFRWQRKSTRSRSQSISSVTSEEGCGVPFLGVRPESGRDAVPGFQGYHLRTPAQKRGYRGTNNKEKRARN